MAGILSLKESDQIFLIFPYHCLKKLFLHHEYAMKGFYKEFALQGSSVKILRFMKLVVPAKWAFNFPKSYIFDLDHDQLSVGVFFILSCLMES